MKFLVTKVLVTVALTQCLLHCAYAAQDDDGDDFNCNTPPAPSDCDPALMRLPDSVTAIILGMCYYASDAELTNLKAVCPEIRRVVDRHPATFATVMKWSRFHGSEKWRHIILTKEGRTAAVPKGVNYCGTVRACSWSPPGGRATATVRVDDVLNGMAIGVLTERYITDGGNGMRDSASSSDSEDDMTLWNSSWAWSYDRYGDTWHAGLSPKFGLSELTSGSVVKVTLDARRVTFNVNGHDQYTFTLPERCSNMNISFGVTMYEGGKVTLLP